MVLYIASQIRLHCQATLSNGLADQATIRKVGSKHRLRFTSELRRYFVSVAHRGDGVKKARGGVCREGVKARFGCAELNSPGDSFRAERGDSTDALLPLCRLTQVLRIRFAQPRERRFLETVRDEAVVR